MDLKEIQSPQDIKKLSSEKLQDLAQEIREAILLRTSQIGGHVGPNLGVVELTLALHRVFHSPQDKIVFDVSHQAYPHKMITGRAFGFLAPDHFDDISGFTSPLESNHDQFTVGHTSTSVALALGLAKARDLQKESYNVVAVIGDGSLSGGESFEGLDMAGDYNGNLIIVVNDNGYSIAENHGGLYANLAVLRKTKGKSEDNYFKDLGLDYLYVEEGHNLKALEKALLGVADSKKPIVVHVKTIKGKGYAPAEKNPELFHSPGKFDIKSGKLVECPKGPDAATLFGKDTYEILKNAMEKKKNVVAITAGTPSMLGFWNTQRKEAGNQFIDVGIAEPAATSLAAGLAKGGAQPVFAVRSSFVQRAYDQITQDVCIDSLPVTFVIFTGSLYAMHDVTHQGMSDIPLLSSIPNLNYLCPATPAEYKAMLEWSLSQRDVPIAIKLPGLYQTDLKLPIEENKIGADSSRTTNAFLDASFATPFSSYQILQKGTRLAILGLGTFLGLAEETATLWEKTSQEKATVINPRFASGVDEKCLEDLKANHDLVVTLEDGRLEGGFGQKVATFYGTDDMQVLVKGLSQKLLRKYSVEGILKENGLTAPQLVAEIQSLLS